MLSEKTYQKLKMETFVAFWDVAEWINMMNDEFDTGFWNVERVKIDTPQQRFKFVRQYIAGLSQNALAQIFKDQYGILLIRRRLIIGRKTEMSFLLSLKMIIWKSVLRYFLKRDLIFNL